MKFEINLSIRVGRERAEEPEEFVSAASTTASQVELADVTEFDTSPQLGFHANKRKER